MPTESQQNAFEELIRQLDDDVDYETCKSLYQVMLGFDEVDKNKLIDVLETKVSAVTASSLLPKGSRLTTKPLHYLFLGFLYISRGNYALGSQAFLQVRKNGYSRLCDRILSTSVAKVVSDKAFGFSAEKMKRVNLVSDNRDIFAAYFFLTREQRDAYLNILLAINPKFLPSNLLCLVYVESLLRRICSNEYLVLRFNELVSRQDTGWHALAYLATAEMTIDQERRCEYYYNAASMQLDDDYNLAQPFCDVSYRSDFFHFKTDESYGLYINARSKALAGLLHMGLDQSSVHAKDRLLSLKGQGLAVLPGVQRISDVEYLSRNDASRLQILLDLLTLEQLSDLIKQFNHSKISSCDDVPSLMLLGRMSHAHPVFQSLAFAAFHQILQLRSIELCYIDDAEEACYKHGKLYQQLAPSGQLEGVPEYMQGDIPTAIHSYLKCLQIRPGGININAKYTRLAMDELIALVLHGKGEVVSQYVERSIRGILIFFLREEEDQRPSPLVRDYIRQNITLVRAVDMRNMMIPAPEAARYHLAKYIRMQLKDQYDLNMLFNTLNEENDEFVIIDICVTVANSIYSIYGDKQFMLMRMAMILELAIQLLFKKYVETRQIIYAERIRNLLTLLAQKAKEILMVESLWVNSIINYYQQRLEIFRCGLKIQHNFFNLLPVELTQETLSHTFAGFSPADAQSMHHIIFLLEEICTHDAPEGYKGKYTKFNGKNIPDCYVNIIKTVQNNMPHKCRWSSILCDVEDIFKALLVPTKFFGLNVQRVTGNFKSFIESELAMIAAIIKIQPEIRCRRYEEVINIPPKEKLTHGINQSG